jgi:prepilin-type processing-associated H-X9-DG protein
LDGLVDCIHGIWGQVDYGDSYFDTPRVIKIDFADITDGLSKTALVLERAGLPDRHFGDDRNAELHDPPQFRTWGNVGLWAISAETLLNHLQDQAGVPIINGDNLHGLYSFHPGGVHIAFGDGSVQFLADSASTQTVFALITREGGEIVSADALQ